MNNTKDLQLTPNEIPKEEGKEKEKVKVNKNRRAHRNIVFDYPKNSNGDIINPERQKKKKTMKQLGVTGKQYKKSLKIGRSENKL